MIFKPRKTTTKQSSTEVNETESKRRIDEDLQQRAEENYIRALLAASLQFQPYQAPVVADLTPGQRDIMRSSREGGRTMGIDINEHKTPDVEVHGGVRGMTAMPAYNEAMSSLSPEYTSGVNEFYAQLQRSLNSGR